MNTSRFLIALLLWVSAAGPAAATDHWVASWGAGSVKLAGETVAAPGVTLRNIVHLSLGGKRIRLTLSNRFGTAPLVIGGVSVAGSAGRGNINGRPRILTFGGSPAAKIAPGATIISDPVAIDALPLGDLAVSIFLPAQTVSYFTGHAISHQTNYRAAGDQTRATAMPGAVSTRPWLTVIAVDVSAPAAAGAIVAFGDSITDGTGTTDDANRRWPNLLAARLHDDPSRAHLAVVDEGIGGNRVLHEGGEPDARAGQHPSAMTRWSYDALDRAGVKYVVLLEGVNDIGHSSMIREGAAEARQAALPEEPVTAPELIQAMTRLIDEAHARGVKVIGATLTPYGGARYARPDGEAIRATLNEFIRHGGKFDGMIDFDLATHDPAQPDRFRAQFNDKDHLHPNDVGAAAMAASIDLNIFK